MIEAERKRAVDRQRAAEPHAAEHLEFAPPLQQQPDELQEVLVPAHRDAVFGDAAETRHDAGAEILVQFGAVADRTERNAPSVGFDARNLGGERLDLEPVDRHDGVAVVHQMVREREASRAEADDQNLPSGRRLRQRPADVERVPARQQRIDFEAIRQRQHVLEHAGLDLRNVDRLLLLVDAGLHAVVADAVSGGGAHRVVDDRNGERADRVALRLDQIHLGDFFVERATREHHAERTLLELAGFLLEALRAGILALVVAPDAVVGVVERAGEIGALIGQREAVARAPMRRRQLEHGDAVDDLGLDRHQMLRIDLVRDLEQHAALVGLLPLRRVCCPGGVARRDVKRGRVLGLGLHPALDRVAKSSSVNSPPSNASSSRRSAPFGLNVGGLLGRIFLRRAALHEQPLHRVERRQRVMAALELGHLAAQCRTARR